MKYRAIKGTRDLLPREMAARRYIEETARDLFERYGYAPIATPVFEQTELFVRGIGEDSDIVRKEMYTFTDRKGRSLTLRPEGTAPVVRAYIENNLSEWRNPTKLYYYLPMYRYERPQKGRMREFYQVGIELLGAPGPDADAEVIALFLEYLTALGLSGFECRVNTIGCRSCRKPYLETLRTYLLENESALCPDCRDRARTNPMRAFDCKVEACQAVLADAPRVTDYVCESCAAHFEGVKAHLTALDIPFVVDRRLVRGFDYYEKTTFEVVSPYLGAQSALGGGGRYDPLVRDCGGPDTPGLGFAIGVERLLLQLEEEKVALPREHAIDAFVCFVGDDLAAEAFRVVMELRKSGIASDMDYAHRSLKAQLKLADKAGARVAVFVAPDELAAGALKIRNMATGDERLVEHAALVEEVRALTRA